MSRLAPLDAIVLALLTGLAVVTSGWPSLATGIAALPLLAGGLVGNRFPLTARGVAGVAVLLPAAGLLGSWLLVRFAEGSLPGTVQGLWICLAVAPAAIGLWWRRRATSEVTRRVRELTVAAPVIIGVVLAEAWSRPLGVVLMGLLIAASQARVMVRSYRRSARRAERLVGEQPRRFAPRAALPLGLVAAVLSLLILGFGAALVRLPRPWWHVPPPPPPESPTAAIDPALSALLPTGADLLARVRVLTRTGAEASWRKPLFLRLRVREALVEEEAGLCFTTRQEPPSTLLDEADGRRNGRVDLRMTSLDPLRPALQFEVRFETDELEWIPVHPQLAWIALDAVERRAGEAYRRPAGEPFRRILLASDPRAYAGTHLDETAVAGPIDPLDLPGLETLEQQLQSRVDRLLADQHDDGKKARRIVTWLKRVGILDAKVPWPGSYRAFLAAGRRGDSEAFAQLFALTCRLAGMRARVAEGYRCGEFDPDTRSFLVRASHRHFWAEVAYEGHGWVGFDPTPEPPADPLELEGPDRVGQETGAAAGESFEEEPQQPGSPSWWMAFVPVLIVLGVMLAPRARVARRDAEGRAGAWSPRFAARRSWKPWQRFQELCAGAGHPRRAGQTATEFAAAMDRTFEYQEPEVWRLHRCYLAFRFGRREPEREQVEAIEAWLRRLPEALSRRPVAAPAARRRSVRRRRRR